MRFMLLVKAPKDSEVFEAFPPGAVAREEALREELRRKAPRP